MNHSTPLKFSLAILLILTTTSTIAQAPDRFSSQVVVRDAAGALVSELPVQIRITILRDAPQGFQELQEVHSISTNVNGLASFQIGGGTWVFGLMESIDWSAGPYFIQTEVDPTNSSNYTISTTTELLSVPYALYADQAGSDGDWIVEDSNVYVPEGRYIGIGTDSPTAPLTVNGKALIDQIPISRGPNPLETGNTAIGRLAMTSSSVQGSNTALGFASLFSSTGGGNTAIGFDAISDLQTGSQNIGLGNASGGFIEDGNELTLIGAFATGENGLSNATAIGYSAYVSKSNSLILGDEGVEVGISVYGSPNEMLEVGNTGRAFFGNGQGSNRKGLLIDGIQGENAARIEAYDYGAGSGLDLVLNTATSSGNVGIRTNNPSVSLDVSGSIEYTGTITDVSDERLKEDFRPIEDAIASLSEIQGYTYAMKDDTDVREYGVIAQEVQKVFPEMVTVVDEENGYLGMSYIQLIPVLLEAIKEQQVDIRELSEENTLLRMENIKLGESIEANKVAIIDLKSLLESSVVR